MCRRAGSAALSGCPRVMCRHRPDRGFRSRRPRGGSSRCRRRGWRTSWLPICPRTTFWWSIVVTSAYRSAISAPCITTAPSRTDLRTGPALFLGSASAGTEPVTVTGVREDVSWWGLSGSAHKSLIEIKTRRESRVFFSFVTPRLSCSISSYSASSGRCQERRAADRPRTSSRSRATAMWKRSGPAMPVLSIHLDP